MRRIEVADTFADPRWRLSNLYKIKNESGEVVTFRPNEAQLRLLDDIWYLNLILKARQLGCTTMVDLILLDAALFNENTKCAIIADSEDKAKEIFDEKIAFPYQNLPIGLRNARELTVEAGSKLEWENGSSVLVGTSIRGLTFQYLHISELGRIAKRFPEKAQEIKTGALNTVHAGQHIFIESTAEGREGLFWDLCEQAHKDALAGVRLNQLSFRLHFFEWFLDRRYRLHPLEADAVTITEEDHEYFDGIETAAGVHIDLCQRAWYVAKRKTQGEDMKREYPSTYDEAWEVSTEGRIFRTQMARVRSEQRIRTVPWVPSVPVDTFWDLGHGDATAIWFHQWHMNEHRFIRYYEHAGEDLSHYVIECRKLGYLFGKWYLPHDAMNRTINSPKNVVEILSGKGGSDMGLGIPRADIVVVPAPQNKWTDSVGRARAVLPLCWFDERNCKDGIDHLDGYEKEWNERAGAWRQFPAHNRHSHGADAFQVFARGWSPPQPRYQNYGHVAAPMLDPYVGY